MNSKLIDKFKAIQKIDQNVEVPWGPMRVFGAKQISVWGDQVSLGGTDCDYVYLDEARAAVEWYVTQLGGKVKWTKT
jgi:hypothetical protein